MLTNYVEGYQHIGIPTDDIKKHRNFIWVLASS